MSLNEISKHYSNKSIAILICYFGKLPWYFDYFVYTCKYNPSIDFYIIIDDTNWCKPLPGNITLIYKTLENVNKIATQKLSFNTNIHTVRKLCDFKPIYGFLFSDIVHGYDFWGHGDIDVIFGDIRNFITDELLENYEIINVRHDYLAGYFLLFKNNEKMNKLFMKSRDFKKVLSSDIHYCFDETNFQYNEFTDIFSLPKRKKEVESMTHVVKRLEKEGYIKAHFDHYVIDGVPGRIKWEKGVLYYRNKYEVLLYHMIMFKKRYKPKQVGNIPNTFRISPARIYT
ncbi:MAG TPA: DUF6625 family protein [Balneolales bacterium]|nr:DUF6625 family protein [Balneolales bacterium]